MDGTLGFAETVRRLAQLFSDAELLEALRLVLPDDFRPSGLNLTKSCVDGMAGSKVGFYSFLYERMFSGTENLNILPAEHLRSRLREFLDSQNVLPNARVELFLRQAPRLNVSKHDRYQVYYDKGLRSVVADRDASLIDRYQYSF